MSKKCLIIYASKTNNTGRIAYKIQEAFERYGWECDSFNVEKNFIIENPPFNYDDFLYCPAS